MVVLDYYLVRSCASFNLCIIHHHHHHYSSFISDQTPDCRGIRTDPTLR